MNRYECQPLEISQPLFRTLLTLCLRSVTVVSFLEILSWALPGNFDISLLSQFLIELSDNLVGFSLADAQSIYQFICRHILCFHPLTSLSTITFCPHFSFHHFLYYHFVFLSIDFSIAKYHAL